jgi:2-polyprenyl-6-methoxyphenol hydroxylase-like FAD-dependent oxidoreductase
MLSPNALRLLDNLGVYERLRTKGYNFESIAFKNEKEETTDLYYLGQEKVYGYKALRVYRHVLLSELRKMVEDCGICIKYEKAFSHIVAESDDGVVFQFKDGSTESAALVVGADGIHSTVRRYVCPSVAPGYSGQVAITCAIQKSKLRFPPGIDYPMPVAIHGKNGAFVMAPQDVDGHEVLAGTQRAYPEQDKAGWDKLVSEKDDLMKLFQTNMQDWPSIVQSALENVPTETLSIWPYYTVPKLKTWASTGQRVIILGDAAHAIPPTAGQGASQAFEDTYTLAVLLSKLSTKIPLSEALKFWQTTRQERIDKVIALTLQLNNTRLPKAERERLSKDNVWQSGEDGQLAWLYNARIEEEILLWAEKMNKNI